MQFILVLKFSKLCRTKDNHMLCSTGNLTLLAILLSLLPSAVILDE